VEPQTEDQRLAQIVAQGPEGARHDGEAGLMIYSMRAWKRDHPGEFALTGKRIRALPLEDGGVSFV
jgi:hypothetical protein